MTRLTANRNLGRADGDKRAIKAANLDGAETLREGQKIVVYDEQVPSDKVRWFGHGVEGTPTGVAHMYASLVVQSDGSPVEGDVQVRLTDSTGDEVLAQRSLGDLGTLSDAESQERTERPAMPALAPYANPDRRLQIVVNADAASDGEKIDPAASSARFWYTQA